MEAERIHYSYDNETVHLRGISTKIPEGKISTIIGPNGSGKSTFLRILARNLSPQEGRVILHGRDIHEYSPKEYAQQVAMVHQKNVAPVDLTVERLVTYGRIPYKRMFQSHTAEDQEIIDFALKVCNLEEKRHLTLEELSGGEQQRVWLAMALAQKPKVLFLDEPTTYLDLYYQLEMLQLIQFLNRKTKMTVVMVLHDINQAIRYSDYLFVMKDGALVMEGFPEDVVNERMMKEIYGIDCIVHWNGDSGPFMIPTGISAHGSVDFK